MAIVVAALGSAPVRRLHKTKEVRIRTGILGLLHFSPNGIKNNLFKCRGDTINEETSVVHKIDLSRIPLQCVRTTAPE